MASLLFILSTIFFKHHLIGISSLISSTFSLPGFPAFTPQSNTAIHINVLEQVSPTVTLRHGWRHISLKYIASGHSLFCLGTGCRGFETLFPRLRLQDRDRPLLSAIKKCGEYLPTGYGCFDDNFGLRVMQFDRTKIVDGLLKVRLASE